MVRYAGQAILRPDISCRARDGFVFNRMPGTMKDWKPELPRGVAAIPSFVFFAAVACAPLPFGSYDRSVSAFWCIVFGIAAAGLALMRHRFRRIHVLMMCGIGVVVLSYAFVLHEQLADHPWIASPNPIWAKASSALGTEIVPSGSITRGEPLFAIGPALACLLSLICGMVVAIDRDRARRVLQVIAWSGVAYAIYGVLSLFLEPTMLLWREKHAYIGNVTGTFVNRNTAAAYFGSCSVVWLAFVLEQMQQHLRGGKIVWRQLPSRLLTSPPRALVLSFAMFFVCIVAMFLTGSRAGVVLSLMAMVFTFTVFFRHDLPPRSGIWIALAGGGLVALIVLQLVGSGVGNRFDVQGFADENRWSAYRSTLQIIADYPWFGTGFGTFVWDFPLYRSPEISMRGVWDIAHNTPLEVAAEGGLPLAGVIGLGWLLMLAVLVRGIRMRRRDAIVPLAAFAVAMIALLHSCVDFSLQIPGFAIVVFALLGAGISQSYSQTVSRAGQDDTGN